MLQVRVDGEDFVGLLGVASDKYAILSENFPRKTGDTLKVPELRTTVYGTKLIGMFCTGNSNGFLVPYFILDKELKRIREFLSGLGVNIGKIADKHTAVGNIIACNDNGAILSSKLSNPEMVEDVLGVEFHRMDVAGHDEVGACIAASNRGFLAHPGAEEQLDEIAGILKVKGMVGSVNCGFPFVKSGLLANSSGYVTGFRTTGIELGRIDEAFGF